MWAASGNAVQDDSRHPRWVIFDAGHAGRHHGLVVSIEPIVLEDWPGDDPMVTGDPASPNALVLSWMGGACEDETVVGFWPDGEKFGMYVSPRGGFGSCPAIGLLRAVRIRLSSPVAPHLISFSSAA